MVHLQRTWSWTLGGLPLTWVEISGGEVPGGSERGFFSDVISYICL